MTGVIFIIGFYLLGEAIAQSIGLPIPGAIIGLIILFLAMAMIDKDRFKKPVSEGADILLRFFPLFLVPIVVGVQQLVSGQSTESILLVVTSVAALILSLILTALIMLFLFRRLGGNPS